MTLNLVFAIVSITAAWLARRENRLAEEILKRRKEERQRRPKNECRHRQLVQHQWLREQVTLVESACLDCGLYDRGPLRNGLVH